MAALGLWLGGPWMAAGVSLSGLGTVLNLWVIMMLTFRLTADEGGQQLALVGLLALFKVPLALAMYSLVAVYFGLLSAFLGLLVLMAPVCFRGFSFLIETSVPADEFEIGSSS